MKKNSLRKRNVSIKLAVNDVIMSDDIYELIQLVTTFNKNIRIIDQDIVITYKITGTILTSILDKLNVYLEQIKFIELITLQNWENFRTKFNYEENDLLKSIYMRPNIHVILSMDEARCLYGLLKYIHFRYSMHQLVGEVVHSDRHHLYECITQYQDKIRETLSFEL